LKGCDLPNEGEWYLEKAAEVTQDGIDLIEKVRKLREVGEEEELKQVAVDKVIKNIISEVEGKAEEKGIEIQYECIDCKVSGGSLLEELFSNLMENSIIHSGCSEIKISSRETEEECIVTIEDDGKGITDEEKEKIFERGYKEGESAGSGLGMYLVKEIVQSYDGSVEVKDSDLGGVRFDVHLRKVQE